MEILSSRSEKKKRAGKTGICARPVPFFFSLQSHLLEVGDVPPPSVSFLLSTGAGSHAAQSIIIARSHIVYIIMFLTNFN